MIMSTEEYAKLVATNLKRLAYESDKTPSEIAHDLNMNKSTLSSWMNGHRVPKMDKIDMLCKYFGCTREDIMEPYDPNRKKAYYFDKETGDKAQELFENPDMRILFDAARNSKPEDLQMAADLLKRLKAYAEG